MKFAYAALFAAVLAAAAPALGIDSAATPGQAAAPASSFLLAPAGDARWVGGYEQDVTDGVAHGAARIQDGVAHLHGAFGGVEEI